MVLFASAGILGGLASSIDGLTWTRRSIGTPSSLVGISRLNGLLVAVGGALGDGGANISKSTVVTSINGKDWVEHESGTTNSLAAAAFGNGRYVSVDASGTITTSANALDRTALPALITNTLHGVAYGNGRFVAVGGDATRATVLSSTDGFSWTAQAGVTGFPTLYAITFAQNQFVAG